MGCCLYFLQCSRAWLALLVPICAVLSSSSHGSFFIPITCILLSTIFLFTFSKKAAASEASSNQEKHQSTLQEEPAEAGEEEVVLMGSQDMYSESESMEQFSSSEDHSSDIEQRLDCSDEESLIEIAIPSGQFVWNNVNCCKEFHKDFWAEMSEINEEDDNLIEIDINIGSIKC
ncbi:uncharacterized protein LOC121803170 [Salvia splendens]|uniref:uncharacterized protein LOC121803170 n=1 Tax=Salvia splendens TaxID=180675 RepID=UPI001C272C43|nr:uncharacterized protein LOC121803170 [Salvia splendens]